MTESGKWVIQCCQKCCLLANIYGLGFIHFSKFLLLLYFDFIMFRPLTNKDGWRGYSDKHTTIWEVLSNTRRDLTHVITFQHKLINPDMEIQIIISEMDNFRHSCTIARTVTCLLFISMDLKIYFDHVPPSYI